ncbi:MAG: glycosyltransferase family 4 protein, partial [Rhabdaerophilum sp.]
DRGMSAAFKTWLAYLSRYADGLACISQATADDVRDYLTAKGNGFHERVHGLTIEAFHLGADLDPHHAQPEANDLDLAQMTGAEAIFLSVGTLEPRKGYGDVLDTAEALWQRGHNVAFVFAGKKGWLVDRLLKRLKKHPELGKRLIFLEQPSDAQLRAAYRQAHAVLLASEGEGFGLPLIEAAHEGKPVLARNLPVFREIGRDGAFYLSGAGGPVWADQIEAWLKLYAKDLHPKSDLIRPMTWDESTAALLDRIETTLWVA